jgi:hypothetical protein
MTLASLAEPVDLGPNDPAETVMMSHLLEAETLPPGALLVVEAGGHITTTGGSPELDVRLRLGPTTLTGAIIGSHHDGTIPAADLTWRLYNGNNLTGEGWFARLLATVQPNGTDITASGLLVGTSGATFAFSVLPVHEDALATFDPTVDNLLELTMDWDDNANNVAHMHTGVIQLAYSE